MKKVIHRAHGQRPHPASRRLLDATTGGTVTNRPETRPDITLSRSVSLPARRAVSRAEQRRDASKVKRARARSWREAV